MRSTTGLGQWGVFCLHSFLQGTIFNQYGNRIYHLKALKVRVLSVLPVCTTPFREQHKQALTRKRSWRPWCTTKQEDKYIRVSSLRNRCLTGPQLAASLNGTRKTLVSTSKVKRRLRDAGLLGRVAKKKPYLRLANKRKILRLRAKEHRHWIEEDWKKVLWTDKFVWGVWITQKNICEMLNKWKDAGGVPDTICQALWR